MFFYKSFIIFLMIILFSYNIVIAGTTLNPTKYLLAGEKATFSGFLVEKDRLEKATEAANELKYYKKLYETEMKYRDMKEENAVLKAKLEYAAKASEDAAIIDALKKELAKEKVFYKQWYFTVPATVLSIILLKIPLVTP